MISEPGQKSPKLRKPSLFLQFSNMGLIHDSIGDAKRFSPYFSPGKRIIRKYGKGVSSRIAKAWPFYGFGALGGKPKPDFMRMRFPGEKCGLDDIMVCF